MTDKMKDNVVFTVDNTIYHVVKHEEEVSSSTKNLVEYDIYRKVLQNKKDIKGVSQQLSRTYDHVQTSSTRFMYAIPLLFLMLFFIRPVPIFLMLSAFTMLMSFLVNSLPDDPKKVIVNNKDQQKKLQKKLGGENKMLAAKNTYQGMLEEDAKPIDRFQAKNDYERENFLDVLLVPESQVAFANIFDKIARPDITVEDKKNLSKAMHNYVDAHRYNVIKSKTIHTDDIQNILADSENRKKLSREMHDNLQQKELE